MRRITDVLINAISLKKLAGPIVMKMAVTPFGSRSSTRAKGRMGAGGELLLNIPSMGNQSLTSPSSARGLQELALPSPMAVVSPPAAAPDRGHRRRPSRRSPPAGTVAPISDSGALEGGIQVRSF